MRGCFHTEPSDTKKYHCSAILTDGWHVRTTGHFSPEGIDEQHGFYSGEESNPPTLLDDYDLETSSPANADAAHWKTYMHELDCGDLSISGSDFTKMVFASVIMSESAGSSLIFPGVKVAYKRTQVAVLGIWIDVLALFHAVLFVNAFWRKVPGGPYMPVRRSKWLSNDISLHPTALYGNNQANNRQYKRAKQQLAISLLSLFGYVINSRLASPVLVFWLAGARCKRQLKSTAFEIRSFGILINFWVVPRPARSTGTRLFPSCRRMSKSHRKTSR